MGGPIPSIPEDQGTYALLVKTQPGAGGVELLRRLLAVPGPGEAQVRIRQAAICGTDLHILGWNAWAARAYKLPAALGHEFSGEVVACGSGVSGLAPGDKVCAETHLACGECAQCRMGRGHTCLALRVFSKLDQGAFAEYANVPAALLRKLPPELPHRQACLMEPLGIALRAVVESGAGRGSLLVSGCGPIGLLAVAAAMALGASRIVATDLSEQRLALALKLGAQQAIHPRDLKDFGGFDGAVEASGAAAALEPVLAAMRPGGTVVLTGMSDGPVPVDLTRHLVLREIVLRGIYGRHLTETWEQTIALLPRLAPALEAVVTHEYALRDFDAAFATARSGHAGKVQFRIA